MMFDHFSTLLLLLLQIVNQMKKVFYILLLPYNVTEQQCTLQCVTVIIISSSPVWARQIYLTGSYARKFGRQPSYGAAVRLLLDTRKTRQELIRSSNDLVLIQLSKYAAILQT